MTWRAAGIAPAAIFFALGSGLAYMASGLPGGSLEEPGPGIFPLLVGALMIAASALHLLESLAETPSAVFDLRHEGARPALVLVAFALFIVLLPRVGFVLPALLLQLLTLQVFGMRGFWRRLAVAAAGTAAAVLVFEVLLGVRFPTPSWSV